MTDEPTAPTPVTAATGTGLGDLSVADLVVRARDGSRASYGELVTRFEDRLFSFLRRRAGDAADAEDLAQETFVRAWQHLDRYDARWQFSTWLFTIGGRLAISRLRRERGRRTLTLDGAGSADLGAGDLGPTDLGATDPRAAPDPTAAADDREQCDRLWDVADRILSDTQRSALWLRYVEDLPPRTIARILGKSQIAVRVMLFRARETLAEHCAEPLAEPSGERERPRATTGPARPGRPAPTPTLPNPVAGGAT